MNYYSTTLKHQKVITSDTVFKLAACLYIFSVCFCEHSGQTLMKIARLALVLAWVINLIDNRDRPLKLSAYFIWVGAVIVYGLITTFTVAVNTESSLDFWLSMVYTLVSSFVLFDYLRYHKDFLFDLLKIFILSMIISYLRIYFTYGFLSFIDARGVEGFNINNYGFMGATALLFSLYFTINHERYKVNKKLYIFICVVLAVFVFLTFSRTAYLYIGVAALIYGILTSKNLFRMLLNILIVCVVAYGIYTLLTKVDFLYEIIGGRLQSAINGVLGIGDEVDASTSTRMGLIEKGLEWFSQRPWFGYGLNGFSNLNAQLLGSQTAYYAHNNFVELLVDYGVTGFVIYYSIYLFAFVKGIKRLKDGDLFIKGALANFIALCVSEYARVSYYTTSGQLMVMICAFVLILYDDKKGDKTSVGVQR